MCEHIYAFEQNAIEKGSLTDKVQNWIGWARVRVDGYDPLINKTDNLLLNNDLENIIDISQINEM
jgi:hypothetical protein